MTVGTYNPEVFKPVVPAVPVDVVELESERISVPLWTKAAFCAQFLQDPLPEKSVLDPVCLCGRVGNQDFRERGGFLHTVELR